MEAMVYHEPVLAVESVDALVVKPAGRYVDVTFGGGGHSRLILERLDESGVLVAFDQDPDAVSNAPEDVRFRLIRDNFRNISKHLQVDQLIPVDGILADLGVSSHQFDEGSRGFSTRYDGGLDMRMDRSGMLTAKDILNQYGEKDLERVFREYGEFGNARTLVTAILRWRPLSTTAELKDALVSLVPAAAASQFYARVFQALRIEVNDEMGALRQLLDDCAALIVKGGRLVVISYHSLEDRMVKHLIQSGNTGGEITKDLFGNIIGRTFTPLHKKTITPTEQEINRNPRARSARMRAAVRN